MSRLLCALYFLALFPFAANATSISSSSIVNSNCTGTLTSSLLDGASFACAGNFTLDGGSITSDSVINISADGDLFLDNLTLTAPNVTFSSIYGGLEIGSGVIVNANYSLLTANYIFITSGATFNVTAVPEPATYAFMLLGLGLILLRRKI